MSLSVSISSPYDVEEIVQGTDHNIVATLEYPKGTPVNIDVASPVRATVRTHDDGTEIIASTALSSAATDADWPSGVIAFPLTDVLTATMPPGLVLVSVEVDQASIGGKRVFQFYHRVINGPFV